MMKFRLAFGLFITVFLGHAQVSFEPGYYIDNDGTKVNCLIKNLGWLNNPTSFEYKLEEKAEARVGNLENTKEFGIVDQLKYQRFEIDIDRSSDTMSKLSTKKEPDFERENLFLKVLLEGKKTLYIYKDKSLDRFFFSVDGGEPKQLVYKRYLLSSSEVAVNDRFKSQLFSLVFCGNTYDSQMRLVTYTKSSLTRYFKDFYECENSEVTVYKEKNDQNLLGLNVKVGYRNASLRMERFWRTGSLGLLEVENFDPASSAVFIFELEYTLPFNRNKWSIPFGFTYQTYYSEKATNFSPASPELKISYRSIEFHPGLRHSFYLTDDSKLFVSVSYVIADIPFDSSIEGISLNEAGFEIASTNNLNLSAGFQLNKKFIVEGMLGTKRNILGKSATWEGEYKTFSVFVGYKLF